MTARTVEAFVFAVAVTFGGGGFALGWMFGYRTCLERQLRRHAEIARKVGRL